MFYLSKDWLSKISFGVFQPMSLTKDNVTKIKLKDSSDFSASHFIFQVVSIDSLTNKHARLIVTDSVKRCYMFVDFSLITNILNPTLKSFARTSNNECMTLLEGSIFLLEEFYYQRVPMHSEFPNLSLEDWILYGQDCVDVVIHTSFDHVIFISQCTIIGHISTPTFVMDRNFKKRKLEFKDKELYTVSRLNNLIRNCFWRIEVLLVKIGGVKEFNIRGDSKIGTCQRFLFRDSSSNIELVVFNDLRLTKGIQDLEEVG